MIVLKLMVNKRLKCLRKMNILIPKILKKKVTIHDLCKF